MNQRLRKIVAAASVTLAGCAETSNEPFDESNDVEYRQGSIAPFENMNIRIMSLSAACDDEYTNDDPEGIYDMETEVRMARIASIARAELPDVITVHNAHMKECRDELRSSLSGIYGNYTLNLESNHRQTGLMIFSRYPFGKLSGKVGFGDLVEVKGRNDGSNFDEEKKLIAVNANNPTHGAEFGAVALARFMPTHGAPFHVVFGDTGNIRGTGTFTRLATALLEDGLAEAHLQKFPVFATAAMDVDGMESSDPDSSWSTGMNPLVSSSGNPLLKCGLNGTRAGTDCLFDPEEESQGALFTDLWGFLQPLTDAGQSHGIAGQKSLEDVERLSSDEGQRQHFVFSNQPSDDGKYLCMQRLRRLFFADQRSIIQDYAPWTYESIETGEELEFRDDTRVSDSFPIVADFLLTRTDRCSPRSEDELDDPIGSETINFENNAVQARSIDLGDGQTSNYLHNAWFKLEEEGTVSVAAEAWNASDDFIVEVYHHSDLSTPISAWHGLGTTWQWHGESFSGPVYDFNDPPYYVRVEPWQGSDLPATGYFSAHKHSCTNGTNDYCIVANNGVPIEVSWPDGQHVQPLPDGWAPPPAYTDSMYFVSSVGKPDSGVDTSAVFSIETSDLEGFGSGDVRLATTYEQCSYQSTRLDCGGGVEDCNEFYDTELGDWFQVEEGKWETRLDTKNDETGALAPEIPGTIQPVLLRVQRSCDPAECVQSDMAIGFDSNFYRLAPIRLTCVDENDDLLGGDDEIYMQIGTDNQPGLDASNCVAGHFAPSAPLGYNWMGKFDEDGDDNKKFADLPHGINAPWNLGQQTFANRAFVSICEDDGGSNPSAHDFIGFDLHDMQEEPLPDGLREWTYINVFRSEDTEYHYMYKVKSEDPAIPPVCTP